MVASRSGLRGSRLVASARGTDRTATMTAYALTSRPAVPMLTSKAELIWARRPTGTSSVVTAANTAAARTSRPLRAPMPTSVAGRGEVTRATLSPLGSGFVTADRHRSDEEPNCVLAPYASDTPEVVRRCPLGRPHRHGR